MDTVKLFLVGDVVLARAIDMIQPVSCDPTLYEGNGLTAHDYVTLAVEKNGPLPDKSKRGRDYVWGDAIKILDRMKPEVRIINLETSVTTSNKPWPRKCVHYKMHPQNVDIIKSGKIDCCILANNHTADWGFEGLQETLTTLTNAGISYAGAGLDLESAKAPAVFKLSDNRRVIVFSGGHSSSGVPEKWAARDNHPGVNVIDVDNPSKSIPMLKQLVRKYKQDGDVIVLSIHWGGNWEFPVESYHQKFAHAVIRETGVDIIHGHSSHHVKGIEVYNGKLIIYGCGDFLTDYEGISGYESFRGELSLMYFPEIHCRTGSLVSLKMIPTITRQLRVNLCSNDADVNWLQSTMSRECRKLGCDVKLASNELDLLF